MTKIAVAVMLIYSVYCVVVFFMQRPILFPVSQIPKPRQPDFKNSTIEVKLT